MAHNLQASIHEELEKIEIEAVEKISIYHENNISRLYLIPSYIAVCKRDKPLSFKEGMKLGMETVLRIAEARERLRLQASESGIRTPTFEDFEDTEVEVLIREIFSLGSRPTSPTPATSPPNGVNGLGDTIKLGPAPSGNHLKANGAAASRANGVGSGSGNTNASTGATSNGTTRNTATGASGQNSSSSVNTPTTGTNANNSQARGQQRDGVPGNRQ